MSPQGKDGAVVSEDVETVEVAPGETVQQTVVEVEQSPRKRVLTGVALIVLGLIAAVLLGTSAGSASTFRSRSAQNRPSPRATCRCHC